jgi:hypothetical protein
MLQIIKKFTLSDDCSPKKVKTLYKKLKETQTYYEKTDYS